MKRKDWKIKKLKEDIFGNYYRRKIKEEKIYMLRKIFLKKNSLFLKKNLVPNYYIFRNFLSSFYKHKNKYLFNYFILYKNLNKLYSPEFFYYKKIFNVDKLFLKEITDSKLEYFLINKKFCNINSIKGNNMSIFGVKDYNFFNELKKKIPEDELKFLSIKYQIINNFSKINIYYNFNCTLNILINIELYKLLILCYLNKLI